MPDPRLKYLYDQFVQRPADKMRGNLGVLFRPGVTNPQDFPSDVIDRAMAGLGVLGSPLDVVRPFFETLGRTTHPSIGQAAEMATAMAVPGGAARKIGAVGQTGKKMGAVGIESLFSQLGLKYKGPQASPKGMYHWFDDPETGSTLLMKAEDLTPEKIMAHVKTSREKFKGQ